MLRHPSRARDALVGRTLTDGSGPHDRRCHGRVRMRTIEKLSKQFMVDKVQAQRVKASIDALLKVSNLSLTSMQNNLLRWSAQLHELGLSISHSHFEQTQWSHCWPSH